MGLLGVTKKKREERVEEVLMKVKISGEVRRIEEGSRSLAAQEMGIEVTSRYLRDMSK